jgi:hypothetical protein
MGKNVYLYIGLPGSWSSESLEIMAVDCALVQFPRNFDTDIVPVLQVNDSVAIADHSLCFPTNRKNLYEAIQAAFPGITLHLLYFVNDPFQCIANLTPQLGEKAGGVVWSTSRNYAIPNNVECRKVPALTPSRTVNMAQFEACSTRTITFRLVRTDNGLVCFASDDWGKFSEVAWYILQSYPKFSYRIFQEEIVRNVNEIQLDKLL